MLKNNYKIRLITSEHPHMHIGTGYYSAVPRVDEEIYFKGRYHVCAVLHFEKYIHIWVEDSVKRSSRLRAKCVKAASK